MHGALADRDGDVLVGDDAGEALGDAVQFYGRGAGRVDDALSLAGRSGSGEGRAGRSYRARETSTRVALPKSENPYGNGPGARDPVGVPPDAGPGLRS
ncbi:hypothetical protein GCM10010275_06070 [Streptomyces litmocidini]|nr:hypothetical protein GCM10010275_06070 [Streptomyces litmocidini]